MAAAEAGSILNLFRDTTQVSVLGYGNNINRAGFSSGEIKRIGGFNRSGAGVSSVTGNGGSSGVIINGISFGGTGTGVQESSGAGANFNTLLNDKTKVNVQYFFGQINSDFNKLSNRNQTLGNEILITSSDFQSLARKFNHHVSGKLEWKPDKLTTVILRPALSFTGTHGNSTNIQSNLNHQNILINNSDSRQRQNASTIEYDFASAFSHDFKKKGRTFYLELGISKTSNLDDNYNYSLSHFFQPQNLVLSLDQLRNTNINNFNISTYGNYTQPLSKKLSLLATFSISYRDRDNALLTFYPDKADAAYTIAIPEFSETVKQRGSYNYYTLSFPWKLTKDMSVQPGLVFNTVHLQNRFIKYPDFDQDYNFLAPYFRVKYKFLTMDYRGGFRAPDVSYIQPVANNTDPLFIQKGNPDLRPSKTHDIRLNLYKYDTKRNQNYNLFLGGNIQNNSVINARTIDANAVQVNTPVNVNGIWTFYSGGTIGRDFKNQAQQFNIGIGYDLNYNRGTIILNDVSSRTKRLTVGPNLNARLNWNDKLEINQKYSLNINNSTYSDPYFSDRHF